jgi:hypothetical protein
LSLQGEYKGQKRKRMVSIQKESQLFRWVVVSPQIGRVQVLRLQSLFSLRTLKFHILYKVEGWSHGLSGTVHASQV